MTGTLTIPLKITTINLGPPYFASTLSDYTMSSGDIKKITLPDLTDDDNDGYIIVSVSLGSASSFIKGTFPSYTISPSSFNTGRFPVTIKVKDDNLNPLTATYTFYVTVSDPASDTSNTTDTNSSASSDISA